MSDINVLGPWQGAVKRVVVTLLMALLFIGQSTLGLLQAPETVLPQDWTIRRGSMPIRGIDPMGVDHYVSSNEWPAVDEVTEYRDRIRSELLDAIETVADRADRDPLAERGRIFEVAIEHELMHQETLQFILQQLPSDHKRRPEPCTQERCDIFHRRFPARL